MLTDPRRRFVALAALDGSPSDTRVVEAAAEVVDRFNGAMHLLHVLSNAAGLGFDPTPGPDALESARGIVEAAARIARRSTAWPVYAHLSVGIAWKEVVRIGRELEADLVLVGTHDRVGLAHALLGSVAEQIARHAACPAVIVRAKVASLLPEIDPPCSECVQVRADTAGRTFFCNRHRERHPHGHRYYEVPESFGVGSMLLRP